MGWYVDLAPPEFFPLGPTYLARAQKDTASTSGYAVYDKVFAIYKHLHRPLAEAFAELAIVAGAT